MKIARIVGEPIYEHTWAFSLEKTDKKTCVLCQNTLKISEITLFCMECKAFFHKRCVVEYGYSKLCKHPTEYDYYCGAIEAIENG